MTTRKRKSDLSNSGVCAEQSILSAQQSNLKRRKGGKKYFGESFVSRIAVPGHCNSIYLTSRRSANNKRVLQAHKVRAMISIGAGNELNSSLRPLLSDYAMLVGEDSCSIDSVEHFRNFVLPKTQKLLEEWLPRGNVLVHCTRGVSRSPLVVFSFLINCARLSVEEAAKRMSDQRSCVVPKAILWDSAFKN